MRKLLIYFVNREHLFPPRKKKWQMSRDSLGSNVTFRHIIAFLLLLSFSAGEKLLIFYTNFGNRIGENAGGMSFFHDPAMIH